MTRIELNDALESEHGRMNKRERPLARREPCILGTGGRIRHSPKYHRLSKQASTAGGWAHVQIPKPSPPLFRHSVQLPLTAYKLDSSRVPRPSCP
ncbi:hypothetical protein BCR43DRAFT_488457 [Syncephalastrum racemosum]|uniref:Uncharacterized protein n=1 Tax=Syncephalastrum racemosum TaxID=13706 RepID=A0A1X2HIM3_SYNRA|nr:hypothetical protein BCR43DRAFT_488457 [Syncephalastrum racemosum]